VSALAKTFLGARLTAATATWALGLFVAAFFVFIVAPIAVVVWVSFTPDAGFALPFSGASLRWYRILWEYQPFVDSLVTSLLLALLSALLAVLLAVPAAIYLGRATQRIAGIIAAFLLAPIAIPALVIGFALLYYLSSVGIGVSFLALLIAHTVVSVPYVTRTCLAVYRNVGVHYEEAASVLGANVLQSFAFVTLPLIAPGIFAGALFSILVSLDNLAVSYFFGTANVTTLPVVMLSYLQYQFDPAIAAISTVQMAITVVLLLIVEKTYGLRALTSQ
jgi:putative spermidine/putrescine transport system permease protein